MPHIEIRDVSLVYDTPAGQVVGVERASFDIEQSEFLCIVGPSGCGKSTLLNIIAGFLPPTGGEIRIAGKPVTGYGMDRGVVFQDFAQLFPWRTALGNVTFGLEMKGIGKDGARADRARAAQARQARQIREVLSAPSVGRHAAAGRHRPRARLQSGRAADGRAVRGAGRADPRRHAAAACRRLAGDPKDRDLRDAQCRRSGLSRRPGGGDDAASRNGEDRGADRARAAARPAQRRVPGLSEAAAAQLGQETQAENA